MGRLQLLMAVHSTLCAPSHFVENVRPQGTRDRLEDIEKQIMEELNKLKPEKNPTAPVDPL